MASNFLDQWKQAGRKINHSGFDISSKRVFSMPAGLQQIPFIMETNPNEFFDIDLIGQMRTMTLNTAAFVNGSIVTSLFFVPYSQIWHNFNSFVSQKDDRHSSQQRGLNYLPQISLQDLFLSVLYQIGTIYGVMAVAEKSYDEIDWSNYSLIRGYLVELNNDELFSEYIQYASDEHGIPYIWNFIRALQYYKLGNPHYVIDEFLNKLDSLGELTVQHVAQAINFVHAEGRLYSSNSPFYGKYVNIMRPAAYQHVFYDMYRNKYFDESPYYQPTGIGVEHLTYVDIFNYDDIECTDPSTSRLSSSGFGSANWIEGVSMSRDIARILNLFSLHYRQYKHDIYTSAMNSTQFGAVSSLSFEGSPAIDVDTSGNFVIGSSGKKLYSYLFNQGTVADVTLSSDRAYLYTDDESSPAVDGASVGALGLSSQNKTFVASASPFSAINLKFNVPSLFDVLQLRRAELMQQWKMNALRAGNMVDDNFRQHYGVEPFYESDNNIRLIGSWNTKFDTLPITATAATGASDNGQVGDLAAIGKGNPSGHKVRFKCNDFGTVIAVSYFLPDVYYTANGIDQNNTLVEPFDFYSEEFENIGFESLPFSVQSIGYGARSHDNLGFVPPFTRYKTNVDEVFGEFGSLECSDGLNFDGALRAWTMQRSDIPAYTVNGVLVRDKKAFYIDPRVTDPIFAIHYNGKQTTDPFICEFNFDIKALRPMSVLGLPVFS